MGQASSLSAQIENLRYSFRGDDGMAESPYGETRDPHVWGYQRCGEWDRLPACLRKLKIYATLLKATTGWRRPGVGNPGTRLTGVTRDAVNGTGSQPVCAN